MPEHNSGLPITAAIMPSIAIHNPQIPPNTGNAIRLSVNSGFDLHLIKPLGFQPTDAHLRRAHLDYSDWQRVRVHEDIASFLDFCAGRRVLGFSTKAKKPYHKQSYRPDDVLLFGSETQGLPLAHELLSGRIELLRLPMRPSSRSLNLANSIAIAVYEAWRQLDFVGATGTMT